MNDQPDKDARLGEDIRLLGRLLGDTIRAYEGEATFNLIEDIRRLAVASRRLEDVASRDRLSRTLDSLTVEQAVAVVRAFSYFSLLANIAEDRHHIRRQRENRRAGSRPLASTLRGLFAEMRERGTRAAAAAAALATIRVYPVLTAHPTEVQRKSNLDCQLAIAQWLARTESSDALPEDVDAALVELRRLVAILWQTRMLRAVRLGVRDEIENALAYFGYTFMDAVPGIVAQIEDAIAALEHAGEAPAEKDAAARPELPALLAIGSWVGGDRDGNPFVTAEMLETAFRRQGELVFDHYLAEVHALGAELPLSGLLARVTPELTRLAELSPDRSPHRRDEPYRKALTGVYARLDATAVALGLELQHRRAVGAAERYANAAEFARDLDVIDASLRAGASALLADGRLRTLRKSVPAFGFHLATVDLRQNSEVHEAVIDELLREAGAAPAYRKLDEAGRQRVLLAELASPATLVLRKLFGDGAGRARDLRGGRRGAPTPRGRRDPAVRHLEDRQRFGSARGRGAAEGSGPRHAGRGPVVAAPDRAALRDHRGPAPRARDDARVVRARAGPVAGRLARRNAGSDARLLGQQQGRRLRHVELGAVQGRGRAGRGVPGGARAAAVLPWTRRHGRARRGTQLRRDPRPAARKRAGRASPHGAGRGDREQVRQPRDRPAQPRGVVRGDGARHARRHARRRARRIPRGDGGALHGRDARLPRPRLRDARLRRILPRDHADQRDRRAQHRLAPRVAQAVGPHRGPAGDPVGVLVGAVPRDAAGLVRLRRGDRGVRRAPRRGRPGAARAHVARVAVLPRDALEPRHAAREGGSLGRGALQGAAGGRGARGSDLRAHRRGVRRDDAGALQNHRRDDVPRIESGARPLDPQPLPLPRPAQSPPAGAPAAPSRGRHQRAREARHPPLHQRPVGGPPEFGVKVPLTGNHCLSFEAKPTIDPSRKLSATVSVKPEDDR